MLRLFGRLSSLHAFTQQRNNRAVEIAKDFQPVDERDGRADSFRSHRPLSPSQGVGCSSRDRTAAGGGVGCIFIIIAITCRSVERRRIRRYVNLISTLLL